MICASFYPDGTIEYIYNSDETTSKQEDVRHLTPKDKLAKRLEEYKRRKYRGDDSCKE